MARQTFCPLYPARRAKRSGWEIRVIALLNNRGMIVVSYPRVTKKKKKRTMTIRCAGVLVIGDPDVVTPSVTGEWKQEGMLSLDNPEHILPRLTILASSHGIPLPPFFQELMSEALDASPAMEQL